MFLVQSYASDVPDMVLAHLLNSSEGDGCADSRFVNHDDGDL